MPYFAKDIIGNSPLLLLLLLPLIVAADPPLPVGPRAPIVVPQKPAPYWSWDRIPTSFHGADKERAFNETEVKRLALYQVLALEKWYRVRSLYPFSN